ncbi:Potassium channel KOR2 [Apostasia shenzhenica]|uniref:Potassium channel KOR2 n=1 Tax=Apostasia shenzhenica TaxID=1088818 RepID=A0A2I0AV00_9ASPA|nr:Potassium channel KOR2 [Apostasia shenzhenica]
MYRGYDPSAGKPLPLPEQYGSQRSGVCQIRSLLFSLSSSASAVRDDSSLVRRGGLVTFDAAASSLVLSAAMAIKSAAMKAQLRPSLIGDSIYWIWCASHLYGTSKSESEKRDAGPIAEERVKVEEGEVDEGKGNMSGGDAAAVNTPQESSGDGSSGTPSSSSPFPSSSSSVDKKKDKARVSRTSLILWHTHQNDASAVRKLLEEDRELVNARDYDNRTPLHVAALHGWIDVAKFLLEYGADVNAQDRWKNTVSLLRLLLFLKKNRM